MQNGSKWESDRQTCNHFGDFKLPELLHRANLPKSSGIDKTAASLDSRKGRPDNGGLEVTKTALNSMVEAAIIRVAAFQCQ